MSAGSRLWSTFMAGSGCVAYEQMLLLARSLWSAAGELDGILGKRDDAALTAKKHWEGPHRETFNDDLDTDSTGEDALVGLLKTAADNWAQAWVDRLNDQNLKRYNKAVSDADSDWEWIPGFSDASVTALTVIVMVPFGPDFEPTGSDYINFEALN